MSLPWSQRDACPDGPGWPDAALRGVAPPPGLAARLGAIPVENDADLDSLLRSVPTPAGLVGRLCQAGAARDEVRKRRGQGEQKAVAASLVVLTWCSYAAALILFWAADYPFANTTAEGWLQTAALVDRVSALDEAAPLDMLDESLAIEMPTTPEGVATSELSPSFDFLALLDSPAGKTPSVSEAAIPPDGSFDRAFLARTGVFPRIDPRNHPLSQPPLTGARDSLVFARQCLDAGRLPPPSEIRTEDFLAAVDFDFERPKDGTLALAALGGRLGWPAPRDSAIEDRSLRLLQLAVQAVEATNSRGGSTDEIAAEDVRLSVRFNPQAVKSYRLCGHEPTHLEGPQVSSACEISAGQAATAVYELELLPDARDAEIATATLEWRDAASGVPQVVTRQVRSQEVDSPFGEAKENVQLAALAVAAAEFLRQSPFAESVRPAEMLALAHQVQSGAQRPQAFEPFVEVFQRIVAVGLPSEQATGEDEGPSR